MLNCSISRRMSTAANALRLESCRICWVKNHRSEPPAVAGGWCRDWTTRTINHPLPQAVLTSTTKIIGETMSRVRTFAFRLLVASIVLVSCFAAKTFAQTTSPSPAPSATPAAPQNANPFAPQPAPPLPAGMTGSDVNDPRAKLSPGMYDAAETSMGIKHLMLLKKPDAFELGANDPNDPKVNKTLTTVLGVADPSKVPGATKLVLAGLGFANSDIAFQGNRLFLGNFYGVNIYDISNPAKTSLLTSMICPGGQGDVSVYNN